MLGREAEALSYQRTVADGLEGSSPFGVHGDVNIGGNKIVTEGLENLCRNVRTLVISGDQNVGKFGEAFRLGEEAGGHEGFVGVEAARDVRAAIVSQIWLGCRWILPCLSKSLAVFGAGLVNAIGDELPESLNGIVGIGVTDKLSSARVLRGKIEGVLRGEVESVLRGKIERVLRGKVERILIGHCVK